MPKRPYESKAYKSHQEFERREMMSNIADIAKASRGESYDETGWRPSGNYYGPQSGSSGAGDCLRFLGAFLALVLLCAAISFAFNFRGNYGEAWIDAKDFFSGRGSCLRIVDATPAGAIGCTVDGQVEKTLKVNLKNGKAIQLSGEEVIRICEPTNKSWRTYPSRYSLKSLNSESQKIIGSWCKLGSDGVFSSDEILRRMIR